LCRGATAARATQRLAGAHVACGKEKEAAKGMGAGTAKEKDCCTYMGFKMQ